MKNFWDETKLFLNLFFGFMSNKFIIALFVFAVILNVVLYFLKG